MKIIPVYSCNALRSKRKLQPLFVNSDSLLCAMAPAKLYAAVDFGGPFLDWLLEHFRQQQKAGEGLDLHLQAENPEDKVMVVPRSRLIGDLVTPGLPITLHIPEASVDTLDLLVQLLYGVDVEVSEDVLPRLRSICKALGLGDWLEETLLMEKDVQIVLSAPEIKETKDDMIMGDETLKELESLQDPLKVSVCVGRRSARVQPLQCELCDVICHSLASLQRHYDKGHFAPASGKRVKGGRVVKSTLGGGKDFGARKSRRMSVVNTLLSDEATDQKCRVNLKDLMKRGGLLTEYLGKEKSEESQLSVSAGSAKVSENGRPQAFAVESDSESSLVENCWTEVLDVNIMKAAEDCDHVMKVAEEGLITDASMSGGRKLKQRGRTQTAGRSSSKHQGSVPARAVTCPRKMLDKGPLLNKDGLIPSSLKKGKNRDKDLSGIVKGRDGTFSSPLTSSRLRSRQCKDGTGGEDVKVTEKEEQFFLLWNKFLADKVVPGSGRLRQHLPSLLNSFFSARAGQINQHALVPQALQHVLNLEEEKLLSQEAASKLMVMLQETIQF